MRFTANLPASCLLLLSLVGCSADDSKATKEQRTKETRTKLASQAAKDSLMLESAFGAFIKAPVPAVQVDDLRGVWSFLNEEARDSRLKGGTAVDIKLLADRCSPNANVP